MKKNLYLIFISLFLIPILGCSKGKNNQNSIRSHDNNENTVNYQGVKLTTNVVDSIKVLLAEINSNSDLNMKELERLLSYFSLNEKITDNSFFSYDENNKLFYLAIDVIRKKMNSNINYQFFLLKLSLIIRNNAEVSEYLIKLTPQIANLNTEGFVKIYETLNVEEKDKIIGNLEYFEGPNEYKKFNENLDAITNSKLKPIASELKIKLYEYLLK
jgi:hypothetical protein